MAKNDESTEETPKAKKPWLLIIVFTLLVITVLGGGSVGALYMTGVIPFGPTGSTETGKDSGDENAASDGHDTIEKKSAIYVPLDPPFVVNFGNSGRMRFLQVSVEVMTRETEVVDAIKAHMPVIRNNLVMLFSSQTQDDVSNIEGKERLRDNALQELKGVLEAETGNPGVEALYFTSFVMQ